MIKKIIEKIVKRLVAKTNYTPEFPLPIQPIIITPEDLKKFHAQNLITHYELHTNPMPIGWYDSQFLEEVMDALKKEIQIKVEETPDGIMYTCDLLFKCV